MNSFLDKKTILLSLLFFPAVAYTAQEEPSFPLFPPQEILVEEHAVISWPSGERLIRAFPVAGPFEKANPRKLSCNKAKMQLGLKISSEELQKLKCVPVIQHTGEHCATPPHTPSK